MEVRCCCDAGRLLGDLPDPMAGARSMTFISGTERVVFEIDWVNIPGRLSFKAYKSRDYPIELLRKIRDFKENRNEISLSSLKSSDAVPWRTVSHGGEADGRVEDSSVPR